MRQMIKITFVALAAVIIVFAAVATENKHNPQMSVDVVCMKGDRFLGYVPCPTGGNCTSDYVNNYCKEMNGTSNLHPEGYLSSSKGRCIELYEIQY